MRPEQSQPTTEELPITEAASGPVERISVKPKGTENTPDGSSKTSLEATHGAPEVIGLEDEPTLEEIPATKRWFAYIRRREFWIVLALRYAASPFTH